MLEYILRISGLATSMALSFHVAAIYPAIVAANFLAAYSLIMICAQIGKFGLEEFLLKYFRYSNPELMATRGDLAKPYKSLVAVLFACSFVMFAFFSFVESPNSNNLQITGFLLALSALVLIAILAAVWQSNSHFLISSLLGYFAFPTTLFIIIFLFEAPNPISAIYYSAGIIGLVTLMTGILRNDIDLKTLTSITSIPRLLRHTWIYLMAGFGTYGLLHLPVILANVFMDPIFTRDLALSLRLSQPMLIAVALLNFKFAPKAREYYLDNNLVDLHRYYLRLFFFSFAIVSAMTLGALTVWTTVQIFEFGAIAALINPQVTIVIWVAFALNATLGPIGQLMIMTDREKLNFFVSAGSTIFLTISLTIAGLFLSKSIFLLFIFVSAALAKAPLLLAVTFGSSHDRNS